MNKPTNKFKTAAKYGGILVALLTVIVIANLAINSLSDNPSLVCKENQLNKVDLEVLEKKIETAQDRDFLFLKVKFVNNTQKGVKIATGNLVFSDLSGNQIYNIDLGYPRAYSVEPGYTDIATIPLNSSREVRFPINYEKSINGLFWLNTTQFKNMECKWTLDKIIYDDGTQDDF